MDVLTLALLPRPGKPVSDMRPGDPAGNTGDATDGRGGLPSSSPDRPLAPVPVPVEPAEGVLDAKGSSAGDAEQEVICCLPAWYGENEATREGDMVATGANEAKASFAGGAAAKVA